MELTELRDLLKDADPVDVFGQLTHEPDPLDAGQRIYHAHAKVAHADRYASEPALQALAHETMTLLNAIWELTKTQLAAGIYGNLGTITSPKGRVYVMQRALDPGDVSVFYSAVEQAGPGALAAQLRLKISKHPSFNTMLTAEAAALTKIRGADGKGTNVPAIHDSFPITSQGVRRHVNVFSQHRTYVTAEELARWFPQGLHGRHLVWVGTRLFAALAQAHNLGIVHGAVLPSHVIIHPETHAVRLIGWGQTTNVGGHVKVLSRAWRAWYAPEIPGKQTVDAWTDLYMAARTLRYLAGERQPRSGPLAAMETAQQRLLDGYLIPNRKYRAELVGWALYDEWRDVAARLYGHPKFTPLTLEASHGR